MLDPLEAIIRLHELTVGRSSQGDPDRVKAEIERCKAELPPDLVDRHEFLVGRYGATAVAPIKAGCCSGCFVQLPSSRGNRVEEGLYACEQCGRLLYDESKVYDLIDV